MKTVIMAGGRGTRVSSIAADIPKPMIPFFNKPILEYQTECLKQYGLNDITIVTGHLGEVIHDYFGDGRTFGVNITYFTETEPLGTGGALFKMKEDLRGDFILVNGDIIFSIDFARLVEFHHRKKALATLVTHPNSHPHDSALIITDRDDRIIQWLNKEEPRLYYKNRVNSGVHVFSEKIFDLALPEKDKVDLDREILKPLVGEGGFFAYNTPEYIKDMGTPERYRQVKLDLENGFVKSRNLSNKQKAVFLDRDGTINKTNGFISKPEDFGLIDGAAEAIGRINRSGYLAIVVTNQPVIARGEASLEDLQAIHNKMETELGKTGAYLDDIFFCPHHPDRGFPGERAEYKIDCECRKPKPGMFLKAAEKYNIDLSKSFMIGDDARDAEAGIAAGCRAVLIKPDSAEKTALVKDKEIPLVPDLKSFAERYLNEYCN
jgi:D-glycero-D-manno-heptose 1,7-bisphosphate phosphatase